MFQLLGFYNRFFAVKTATASVRASTSKTTDFFGLESRNSHVAPPAIGKLLNYQINLRQFGTWKKCKRPRGLMDKASDFGSEDCAFESHRGRLEMFFVDSLYAIIK